MSQPDYFQLACDSMRARAEELKRACFNCHEDTSETVMLCPLHAQAKAMRAALAEVITAYDHPSEEEGEIAMSLAIITARAILAAIEGPSHG